MTVKPHLRVANGRWICGTRGFGPTGIGFTKRDAYVNWWLKMGKR